MEDEIAYELADNGGGSGSGSSWASGLDSLWNKTVAVAGQVAPIVGALTNKNQTQTNQAGTGTKVLTPSVPAAAAPQEKKWLPWAIGGGVALLAVVLGWFLMRKKDK